MRFDRLWVLGALVALAGCVTTHTDSNPNGKNIPQTSKADQALDAARVHTELGQRYLASGDLQKALAKLTMAVHFDPNYAPARTVIAVVYERINDLPNAELNYRKAVMLEPAKGDVNNNLGLFLCSTGRYAEADGYFAKALADPFYQTPDIALTNDGVCKMRMHDVAGAEKSFRSSLARNPNNPDTLYQLAKALYLNNDAFRARAFIQRLDALGSPTPDGLKLGYDIEMKLGNRDGALSYSSRLQSQFPDSEQARALNSTVSP
jgi:type IV pilus assembly protein PilF